jgi:D-serine deaminase-like pyridoxal phosphate-dependent protein
MTFAQIPTPALLLHRDRIEHNLRLMIEIAGGTHRLRPHVKTHKLAPLIRRQVELGITKFKCSTIAECEMVAAAGGKEAMLAMPPVGANSLRLVQLIQQFPDVRFTTIADDEETVRILASAAQQHGVTIPTFLELDCGMGRTGVRPGAAAKLIVSMIRETPRLGLAGLHCYDGHIHESDLAERTRLCDDAFRSVIDFKRELEGEGVIIKEFVCGGSPTFGIHAQHEDRTLSPGTTVLWDFGYGDRYPDLPFQMAAVLLTKVISKPGVNRVTLDLGHKSVAPEAPHPRVRFVELPDAPVIMQSEEHLVLEVEERERFAIGAALHGIPRHVCPTVSMHGDAYLIEGDAVLDRWEITARDRRITV